MTARTYYPDPEPTFAELPPPEHAFTDPDPTVIRFGYTLHDLDQLTHGAMIADRSMALDYADRRDVAWSAIAEALVVAQEPPTRIELIRVGWQAIYRTVRDSYRSRGYRDGDYGDGVPTMPRFVMFWGSATVASHEDRIVESIAVDQVLGTLNPTYRDAITALALREDYVLGAEALGINYKAFVARISTARKQILGLWHEGEIPHRPRRTDRRVEVHGQELAAQCSAGHEWTPENTRWDNTMVRGVPKRARRCRACERDRGRRRAEAKRR